MTAIQNLFKDLNGSTVYRFPINYSNYPDLFLENVSFLINVKKNDENGWSVITRIEKDGKSLTATSSNTDLRIKNIVTGPPINPNERPDTWGNNLQTKYNMLIANAVINLQENHSLWFTLLPYGSAPYRSDRIQLIMKLFDADGKLLNYTASYQGAGVGIPLSGPYDIIND